MKNKALDYFIYVLCGVLMAIPFSFADFWFLSWIAFVPVLFLEYTRERNVKHPLLSSYRYGMAFFYPYGIMTFYWFTELYPLDFAGLSKGGALCVVLLGTLGLSLLQAVFWSFMFVFMDLFIRNLHAFKNNFLMCIIPGLLWVVFEWLHAQTWAGVPWESFHLDKPGSQ